MKTLLADPVKCTACRQCEIVCSVQKTGVSNPNRSPIRVIKREDRGLNIPVHCQHCIDAPCVKACPKEAIVRDNHMDRITINQALCVRCQMCVSACPFGAVDFDKEKKKIFKCNLCNGEPQCVAHCPEEAIQYIDIAKAVYPQKREAAFRLFGSKGIPMK